MKLEIENGVLKKIHMLYFGDDDIKDIVIPYGVTQIGYQAFASDRHQIDSITIPDTVTEIGESAFEFCYALTSLTIGKGLKVFGDDAFSECDNLKRITLPSREFELDPKAFDRGSNFIINYKEY